MNLHPQLKNPKFYIVILSDALIFVLAIFWLTYFVSNLLLILMI